ncbi:HXXEE domain-containing protein [Candidatus Solincola tengchongensis]|uniref:HXXEE domain-containing protein n=1 Tax=Candidatus Solincola tengchongensis TaxID=2900693 RepID=UPI00257CCF2E
MERDKGEFTRRWDEESKVFWYLTAASCAHVVEEYFWPGGFLEAAKEVAPEAFENASLPIIVGVNASMIAGCAFGSLMRKKDPSYGLSMAGLLFFNALLHLGASLKARKYVPGLATGLTLYVPLAVKAFSAYRRSERYRLSTALRSAAQGVALHAVPFVAFAVRGRLEKRGSSGVGE